MPSHSSIELSRLERAILRTVVYSSLFEFPLTLEELRFNLLESRAGKEELRETLRSSRLLQHVIEAAEGFIFLQGERRCIGQRRDRESRSKQLLQDNRRVLKLVCALPCIRMVALSGSAAHANVEPSGDIDLLIITRGKRVWWAAVSILLLTKLLGRRRTLCFNFILSDRHLKVEPSDLFSANQMIHLRPLIGEDVCRRFWQKNPFVGRFYPSSEIRTSGLDCRPGAVLSAGKRACEWILALGVGAVADRLCRGAYSAYLRRKATGWSSPDQVVLGEDYLKLHTQSHRAKVLESFERGYSQALDRITAGEAVRNQELAPRSQKEGILRS